MTVDPRPLVSVIIPVIDDQQRLDACLEALGEQAYPRDAIEIIVVDNGSRRPVQVRDDRARVVVEPHPGPYAARNAGVRAASGQILAFTDADCLPEAGWLSRGVERLLAEPGCGLVAGAIQVFCHDEQRPTLAELYELVKGFPQRRFVEQDHFGATANILARREVVEAVGGFDGSLISAGDVDFGHRVRAAGYRLVYEADSCVRHPARRSMKNLLMKVVRTEVGLKHLAKARGYTYPLRRDPPLMRIMAAPVAVHLQARELHGRDRLKAAAATFAVEAVRAGTRILFDLGLVPDVRRYWGR